MKEIIENSNGLSTECRQYKKIGMREKAILRTRKTNGEIERILSMGMEDGKEL